MISPGFIGRGGPDPRAAPPDRLAPSTALLVEAVGEAMTEALCLAALAPSSHNTQPWLVLVHGPRRWSLALAPDRCLPVVDPADRESLVSLGAFLENLVVAAGNFGVDVQVTGYASRPDDPELVRLAMPPGAPPAVGATASLVSRRTLRGPFSTRPVDPRDVEALCAGVQGVTWIPGDSPYARRVRDVVVGAVRRQVSRDDAQDELADWLRWSDDDVAHHRDGLTPASLGLTGVAAWWARRFFDRDTVRSRLFRRQAVAQAAKVTGACGGWLVVSGLAPGVQGSLEAGRAFEQAFLRARGLGLGIHPMSQPLEEPGWRGELESAIAFPGYPRMLLRVGYVDDYPPPVSPRRPPAAFTRVLTTARGTARRRLP